MAKRQVRSFRPMLDPLESRVVLSASPTAPIPSEGTVSVGSAPVPVLTPGALHRVLNAIHQDFVIYEGEDTSGILNTLSGVASDLTSDVASAILSPSTPNPMNTLNDLSGNNATLGNVSGGKGDVEALEVRLRWAVDHLPFEAEKAPALFGRVFGLGGLNTSDADTIRDEFKRELIHDLKAGRQAGEFVYRSPGQDHPPIQPAPDSATVQPASGKVD